MGNSCLSKPPGLNHDSASHSESGVGCGCCGLRARSTGDVKAQDECNGTVSAEEASAGEKNGGESLNTRWRVLREESYVASVDSQLDSVVLTSPSATQATSAAPDQPEAPTAGASSSSAAAAATATTSAAAADPLHHLPEAARRSLCGRSRSVRAPERGFNLTVYVASTGCGESSELRAVLDAAVAHLNQVCAARGVPVQVLDRRQLSVRQEDHEDHMTRVCLSTLKRLMETTHLIPILMFNDTLGSTLLPRGIEAQDFQTALASTHTSSERDLIETWYHLDQKTQPPCYRLQSTTPMDATVQQRLLEIFVGVFSPELSDAYLTTLFEQEVHNSVCMSQELARRCLWIQHGAAESKATPAPSVVEQENRRRVAATQKALKSLLQEKHIFKSEADAAAGLDPALRCVVDELLDDVESKEAPPQVACLPHCYLEDVDQHLTFAQRAASDSTSREAALTAIKRYVTSEERHPLIVHGRQGSGKTCLSAHAVQHCHAWCDETEDDVVVVARFANLTPRSRSLLGCLHSIAHQCALLVHGRPPRVPHTLSDYKAVLADLFYVGDAGSVAPGGRRKTVVIVDGVDQLEDFADRADLLSSWMPRRLPAHVKLILTLRSGPHVQHLQSLLADSGAFYQLEELSLDEARTLSNACLLQHAPSFPVDPAISMESRIAQCRLPVSVKILAWQAGLVGTSSEAATDSVANLTTVIENIFGAEQASTMICYLTLSRYGLCDYEMERLCRNHLPSTESNAWNQWPKLVHFLAPFLSRIVVGGLNLVTWRDSTVRQQMEDHYLADDRVRAEIHSQMLNYYQQVWSEWRSTFDQRQSSDFFSNSWPSGALRLVRRALDEIPHHLLKGRQSTCTEPPLLHWMKDFTYLLSKMATSGVFQVIEDLDAALQQRRSMALESLRRVLINSAPALDYDYRQLYGQLTAAATSATAESSLSLWLEPCQTPLIDSFVPGAAASLDDSAIEAAAAGPLAAESQAAVESAADQQVVFSAIHRLVGDDDQAAVLSTARDEMSLWNFRTGQCTKVLSNLHQPLKVAPMANHRCVVLCGRELRVYDIDAGQELLKLKGIMNQKLPLFGLHGDSHVVSLSRNRMYVNLISLENGDCETTFKVGEDRFLNSLLVSDNGRILVCGDESKRPCSLLVWDLQAKKLIYDLKMNHHEFITRLSAITGDGTYVSCVCNEVDTSDPNFLVVYDLQNGTLFKKWKAGVNTLAVTIACQNTCVATSMEDSRILIWDLVTGNCRWTLLGHTSAADMLNLDAEGTFLLSWDSCDHDRSLRLWNLTNGRDVATFTPDRRTTAVQLASDGQTLLVASAGRSTLLRLSLTPPRAALHP